jgi:hypothetical protein
MQVISKSELLQTLKEIQCQMYRSRIDGVGAVSWFSDIVNEQTVIDAAPVVHAKWISEPGILGDWYCSNCKGVLLYEVENYGGGNYHDIKTVWSTYCPHCGAKMDGD